MNSTHFRNQLTGSLFTKLECQIACALVEHVRTRRHRRGNRDQADHTQPPTLRMLNDILQFLRSSLWYDAQRMRLPCNSMSPYAHLDAYCLVRSLRTSPSHGGWYTEVENNPRYWKYQAYDVFDRWVDSRRQDMRRQDMRRQDMRRQDMRRQDMRRQNMRMREMRDLERDEREEWEEEDWEEWDATVARYQ